MPLATLRKVTLTILSGASSGVATIGDGMFVGFTWPAAFTGTTVTVTASPTLDGTYASVYDSTGTAVGAFTKHLDATQAVDPATFAGVGYVTFTSTGTEGANRAFTLWVRN